MRIVQVANLVHATSGGLRTTLAELGRGYAAAGHDRVELVAGAHDDEQPLPGGGRRCTLAGTAVPGGAGYHVLLDRRRVRAALEAIGPDAVEVHDRFTLGWVAAWAAARDLPATVVVHERLDRTLRTWTPLGPLAGAVARTADRRLAAAPARLVAASAYAASPLRAAGARVDLVPLGVDLDRFCPSRRRRPPGGPIRLVALGRLSPEKRIDLAIEAVRELVEARLEVRLDVLGAGPLEPRLTRRAEGLPVRFRGHLPPDRTARVLAGSDLLLAPCRVETYGLAALEALASGVPVVAADAGALPELLAEAAPAAGTLAGPAPAEVAAGVLRLLDHPRARRSAAARAVAERRPWSATVARLLTGHGAPATGLPR